MGSLITLGTLIGDKLGQPLTAPRSLFGHMHVRGMTGSGKTSLGLIPLIQQFIEPDATGSREPMVVLDLAGDQNLFHHTKTFAEQAKRRFRYFALESHLDTEHFPVFQALPEGQRDVVRIAQLLIQAFHLDHGIVYGGQYFSQQNLAALLRVARTLADADRKATLEDIRRYLDAPANRRAFRDADQIRLIIDFLLEFPQLAEPVDREREINLSRAVEQAEVVYFFLPTLTQPVTARLVAGLALYTLIDAAIKRHRIGAPPLRCRVFIDEFQEIVGRSLAALLAQSRKFGVSLFLSNQSTSQLDNRDIGLSDIVFEGTSVKQYFTCVGRVDTDALQSLSEDVEHERKGRTVGPGSTRDTVRIEIGPRLERNTILAVTGTFGRSLVIVNRGQGHEEPQIVEQRHELQDRSADPFPPRRDADEPKPDASLAPNESPPEDAAQRALGQFVVERQAEEDWQERP
jgi:hypothetical protein